MSNPFINRLHDYYVNMGKALHGEADSASIFPNTTDIGMTREQIYAKMLKVSLPSACNVFLGGFLFNQQGDESKQIDILVLNDTSPQFNFHNKDNDGKTFACVDGCIGVVSVKSSLTRNELKDALANIASIPDKRPLASYAVIPGVTIPNYSEWPYKIIYASNGSSSDIILETLGEFRKENPTIPLNKMPNLIHVAGKYIITRALDDKDTTRAGMPLPSKTFIGEWDETNIRGLTHAVHKMQLIALASRYIVFTYEELLNNIPLP